MSTGTSYLNSNVSLISKASIRYEGTLYSINPQEATITLSNVKSYGTEERKVDKFLAPKDTLFEYIIFKANDIKELIVDEPLNDPAIVTATTSTSTNNAYSGFSNENQTNLQANGLSSDAQATLNGIGSNTNQTTGAQSVSSAGQAGDRFRSRGSTPSGSSQARSPVSELSGNNKQRTDLNKVMNRGNNNHQANNRNQNNQQQQRRGWENNNRVNNNYTPRNNQPPHRGNYNNNQMNRRPGYQSNYQSNYNNNRSYGPRNDDRMNNNRNGPRNNYTMNNNRGMMRGNGRKFVPQSNKKFDATLKTEFDFEKANEVFQQMVDKIEDLSISANGEKNGEKSGSEDKDESTTRVEVEKSDKVDEDGNFYDKTKSFFDNISCEAIERTKGSQKRFDWKQERKLNAETFGLKITYRRPDGGYRRPGGNNLFFGKPKLHESKS